VLACYNEDSECVRIFDLDKPWTAAAEVENGSGSIEWSPSGNLLATISNTGGIKLWNSNGAKLGEISSGTRKFLQIRFNECGKLVVAFNLFSNYFEVFEVDTGDCLQEVTQGPSIDQILWKNGQEFFTQSKTTINIWRVGHNIHLKTISIRICSPMGLQWDSRSGILATVSDYEGSIQLWRPDSANLGMTSLSGHSGFVEELLWSPNGSGLLASWDCKVIIIWDTVSGTSVHRIENDTAFDICPFSFSPDGLLFACGWEAKEVQVWKTDTWELAVVCEVEGECIKWSPRGDKLAVQTNIAKVCIFNMKMKSLKTSAMIKVASCLKNQLGKGREKKEILSLLEIPDKLKPEIGLYL